MEKREIYRSLNSLAKQKVEALCSLGTGDGTMRALFSSDATDTYVGLKSCTFGLRPKFPAFKGWKGFDE